MEDPGFEKIVSKDFFRDKVLQPNHNAVVVFSAEWLGNAFFLINSFQLIREDLDGVNFYEVDVEITPDLASEFGIYELPSTLFLVNGEVVDFCKGLESENQLRERCVRNFK